MKFCFTLTFLCVACLICFYYYLLRSVEGKEEIGNESSFESEKELFRGGKYASLDTVSKMRSVVKMKYKAKEKYAKR